MRGGESRRLWKVIIVICMVFIANVVANGTDNLWRLSFKEIMSGGDKLDESNDFSLLCGDKVEVDTPNWIGRILTSLNVINELDNDSRELEGQGGLLSVLCIDLERLFGETTSGIQEVLLVFYFIERAVEILEFVNDAVKEVYKNLDDAIGEFKKRLGKMVMLLEVKDEKQREIIQPIMDEMEDIFRFFIMKDNDEEIRQKKISFIVPNNDTNLSGDVTDNRRRPLLVALDHMFLVLTRLAKKVVLMKDKVKSINEKSRMHEEGAKHVSLIICGLIAIGKRGKRILKNEVKVKEDAMDIKKMLKRWRRRKRVKNIQP